MVVLQLLIVWLLKGHVFSTTLRVTPNYILKDTTLSLECDVNGRIENITAIFYMRSSVLGYVSYDLNGCHSNNSDRVCSSSECSCDVNTSKLIRKYTPQSTPPSDIYFRCDLSPDSQSSNNVTIKPAFLPSRIDLSPNTKSYTITRGETLNKINCSASTCWPPCTFKWVISDGSSLNGPELKDRQPTKDENYYCEAKNVIGPQNSDRINVTVLYGPTNFRISPTSKSYSKTEGSFLGSIRCSADCVPTCEIKWTYPDGKVYSNNTLFISSLQKTHHGFFTCTAKNGIANNTITVSVNVNYRPENVTLNPDVTSHTVRELSTLKITCNADCRPNCNYIWTGPNSIVLSDQILQIKSIQRSSAGQYRCEATNTVGNKYSPFVSVVVHTRPTKVQKVTVICPGATTASIAWIPDDTVVPGQHFTVHYKPTNAGIMFNKSFQNSQTQNDIYILYIDNLQPSTEYIYTISSENYLGRYESNQYRCTTAAASTDASSINGALIAGIVMICLALIPVIIIVTFFLLQRYRKLTGIDDDSSEYKTCFSSCPFKLPIPCLTKDSSMYENTKQRDYENVEGKEGQVNETEVSSESSESYEELKRRSTEKAYAALNFAPTGETNGAGTDAIKDGSSSSNYVNVSQLDKNRKEKEKKALKPPNKALRPPKKGLNPPVKAKKPVKMNKEVLNPTQEKKKNVVY